MSATSFTKSSIQKEREKPEQLPEITKSKNQQYVIQQRKISRILGIRFTRINIMY